MCHCSRKCSNPVEATTRTCSPTRLCPSVHPPRLYFYLHIRTLVLPVRTRIICSCAYISCLDSSPFTCPSFDTPFLCLPSRHLPAATEWRCVSFPSLVVAHHIRILSCRILFFAPARHLYHALGLSLPSFLRSRLYVPYWWYVRVINLPDVMHAQVG